MNLRDKRKNELENQKEKRKEEVVAAAIEAFKGKGIENTKMTDIAETAQVGIASVYRYFKTKPDLVIEAATKFWEEEISILYNDYDTDEFRSFDGISQIKNVLNVYIKLFEGHRDFLRFIEEFDNYIIKEKIPQENLEGYENTITALESVIIDAVETGKRDGTIDSGVNCDVFYSTTTHALTSLCQKLILRGRILKSDNDISDITQIKTLIDMAVGFIGNK